MTATRSDTVYDRTHPWQTNEERLTGLAMRVADIPADQIRAIRPVVPVAFLPPREGYPSYADRQPGIASVGLLSGRAQQTVDYSQRTSGYTGSLRNGFPALNTF